MNTMEVPVGSGSGFIWDNKGELKEHATVTMLLICCNLSRTRLATHDLDHTFNGGVGHVVTNFHVIKGASDIKVALIDQSVYPAKVPSSPSALMKARMLVIDTVSIQ